MHMRKITIYVILLLCYYTHFLMDWLTKTLQRNLGFEACKPFLTMYPVQSTRFWVWGKPAHTSWPWVRSACKFRTCHLSGPHKATPSPVHRRLPQITPWGKPERFISCVSVFSRSLVMRCAVFLLLPLSTSLSHPQARLVPQFASPGMSLLYPRPMFYHGGVQHPEIWSLGPVLEKLLKFSCPEVQIVKEIAFIFWSLGTLWYFGHFWALWALGTPKTVVSKVSKTRICPKLPRVSKSIQNYPKCPKLSKVSKSFQICLKLSKID